MLDSSEQKRRGFSIRFLLLVAGLSIVLIAIAFAEDFEGPFFPIAGAFVGSVLCARFAWYRFDHSTSGATTFGGCVGAVLSMICVLFIEAAFPAFRDFIDPPKHGPGSFPLYFPPWFTFILVVFVFILPSIILGALNGYFIWCIMRNYTYSERTGEHIGRAQLRTSDEPSGAPEPPEGSSQVNGLGRRPGDR